VKDADRLRLVDFGAGLHSWSTGRLLVVAGRMAYQGFRDILEAHDVTLAGLHVLGTLRDGPRAQIDVAARCGVQTQTAGRTIARLAGNGLVTRQQDPGDRRRQLVRLTDKGQAILDKIGDESRQRVLESSLFDELEDQEQFRSELIRLIRRLLSYQAADRAAQWTAVAERWADDDTAAPTDARSPGDDRTHDHIR
jgi:MarR family transcriptional regulator, organic hydroperoxide resistance regulator